MTNQAAQTMPEPITASMCPSSDYAKGWNDCLAAMLAAAPAASGGEDAVAWTEKERKAINDMMATQEFSYATLMRQAIRLYQHDLMRRKDGETCTWSGDEQRAREFAGTAYTPPNPPSAAPVSERARSLLAAEYRAAGFNAAADWIAEADMDAEENDLDRCVIRALEQALTQQRGEEEGKSTLYSREALEIQGARWRALCRVIDHMAPGWDANYVGAVDAAGAAVRVLATQGTTTPQPGAEALRELVQRWRDDLKYEDEITAKAHGKFADELESLLGRGGK